MGLKLSPGRVITATAIGLVTAAAVRRVVGSNKPAPASDLEPWEREALNGGDVGETEGEAGFDEAPVGSGKPIEHCVLLGAGEGADLDPHCIVNPLADPRFAPVDRGAPAAAIPPSSTWPLLTKHSGRLTVSYWTTDGVRGYSGRAFAASRTDTEGGVVHKRKHAGVDLFARDGDVVVAPEAGTVLAILPFHAGTWAVYLRVGDRVINLGEVEKLSWREFGISPGQPVIEGQKLARVGVQEKGSTMLHVEIYEVGATPDADVIAAIRASALSWPADRTAPAWLRDPSGYLVMAASRTHRKGLLEA